MGQPNGTPIPINTSITFQRDGRVQTVTQIRIRRMSSGVWWWVATVHDPVHEYYWPAVSGDLPAQVEAVIVDLVKARIADLEHKNERA